MKNVATFAALLLTTSCGADDSSGSASTPIVAVTITNVSVNGATKTYSYGFRIVA